MRKEWEKAKNEIRDARKRDMLMIARWRYWLRDDEGSPSRSWFTCISPCIGHIHDYVHRCSQTTHMFLSPHGHLYQCVQHLKACKDLQSFRNLFCVARNSQNCHYHLVHLLMPVCYKSVIYAVLPSTLYTCFHTLVCPSPPSPYVLVSRFKWHGVLSDENFYTGRKYRQRKGAE